MSRHIRITVNKNDMAVLDGSNGFQLLFKIKHFEIIKCALDIASKYTLDIKLEDLRIIKELNNNYKIKQISSNWVDPSRAQLIKYEITNTLGRVNIKEQDSLIDILDCFKVKYKNKSKLKEFLYKLEVKELDYLKSKGEETNEKSSS